MTPTADKQFASLRLKLNIGFEVDMMSMVKDFPRYGFGIGAVILSVLQQSKNWRMNLFEVSLKHNFEPGNPILVKIPSRTTPTFYERLDSSD